MTINVEDYEHVENIGTDSGIKVSSYMFPKYIFLMTNMFHTESA